MCPRQLNLRQPREKSAPLGPAASGLTIEGAAAPGSRTAINFPELEL